VTTIYEVAEAAGVSPNTAARILAGYNARKNNREQVLAAAKKLGYVRNQHAANLRSGKSGLIGMIIPPIYYTQPAWFYQIIQEVALDKGYQTLLSSINSPEKELKQALELMEASRVEGLIFNVFPEDQKLVSEVLRRFQNRNVPIIVGGCKFDDLKVDEIVVNNHGGMTKAVEYLLRTGRRKFGFVSGPIEEMGNQERFQGYREALKKESIEINEQWIIHSDGGFENALAIGMEFLGRSEIPDAVVCTNDVLALGIIRAGMKLSIPIPQQLSVIGFDDTPWTRLTTPALTTLYSPLNRIARDTIKLLMDRIQGDDLKSPPRRLVYEPELVIRESA
jgi:DNA-binding LacI/PurR family transcriptional regulator